MHALEFQMTCLNRSAFPRRRYAIAAVLPLPHTPVPAKFSFRPRCSAIRSVAEMSSQTPTVSTATISYDELKDLSADLSEKIELGFGPNSLGILSVSDVPGYPLLRRNLLRIAPRLASLPEDVKRQLEDPSTRYNIGWSHGKEKLESGKPDMLKGSFYANPIVDVPTNEQSLVKRYPSYCGPNIWPHDVLPELELDFKALGKLILDVGLLLAHHCDRYASNGFKMHENGSLQQILLRSRCHKGRLLYYFPAHQCTSVEDGDGGSMSSWCGWHTDHGSLTGLTCAIFTRDAVEIPCPDSTAGLYVKTRSGQIVKVVYGEDEIAYQIGETTEILSGGQLCATPHCVRAPKGEGASGVERSTFALFMQPNWDEKLNFPELVNIHEFIMPMGSISFGDYTEKVLDKYYDVNA
ncbi:2-oxoglutarate and oxygenase superfamily protein [Perilla frutescens var. hirtella]|uniref:2-oxoglutarate and oxygenase superfamily protein n=1 Tax=Perilla frutescens var. hirtella TaxID=608512 RepID=A0AAD4J1I1_PERFH|nr:2-oxoglutarate and oxygenase superfamily protein [Perilla frutescens var. hirtella]